MKIKYLALIVSATLLGAQGTVSTAYAAASTVAGVAEQSVSTSSTVQVTPGGEWYSSALIKVSNTSGVAFDLDSAQIHVLVPENSTIGSIWGPWGTNDYTVRADGQVNGQNRFIIEHGSFSQMLAHGSNIEITAGVNNSQAGVVGQGDIVVEKVVLKNDPALTGKISITAPSQPHASLNQASVLVEGSNYSETKAFPWGGAITIDNLVDGEYHITALDVTSATGIAKGASESIVVKVDGQGSEATATIDYQPFIYFAGIDLRLPELPGAPSGVSTTVSLALAGESTPERTLALNYGAKVDIEALLDGHQYDLSYTPTLFNNVSYLPLSAQNVLVDKQAPTVVTPLLESSAVDSSGFTPVTAAITGLPQQVTSVPIRLKSVSGDELYAFNLPLGSSELSEKVKPGQYYVEADTITVDGQRYVLDVQSSVTIAVGTTPTLALPFKTGIKLAVKGFPDFVANGTVTNDSEGVTNQIGATRVDAIFKYAGFSGSGDPGVILTKAELSLHRTMANAKSAQAISGKHVLPVMVVYTANASGGAVFGDLTDDTLLYKHYATFMTQAVAAQEYAKGDGHSPMSFVLNPDFLGELQKNPNHVDSLNQQGAVNVNARLAVALEYMKNTYGYTLAGSVPTFEDNLRGYIQSLNYVMKAMAPDVSFGWQINLWAVGSANWVHSTEDQSADVGSQVGDFVNSLGVYSGQYQPDYIVFDKYERDGFGSEAIANYAYNATSWQRYLNYTKVISDAVQSPAMIWQIPGGHMPTQAEGTSMIASNHQASGGSFFMGDSRIGSDVDSIYTNLLDKTLSAGIYNGASNVRQLLEKDNGYDWSAMRMQNLPKYNVFALLWGGGSTTAVVSIGSNGSDNGWLNNKVTEYAADPACLYGSDCDGSIWGGNGGDEPSDNKPPVITLDPFFNANSGQTVTVTASASDPEGEQVSYSWSVPAAVTVVSGANSGQLVVTAPVVATDTNYTLNLTVSDGVKQSTASTLLKVAKQSGGEGNCGNAEAYVPGQQYKPGQEVVYENNLYRADRWTDVGKNPDQPYTGWVLVEACN